MSCIIPDGLVVSKLTDEVSSRSYMYFLPNGSENMIIMSK